MALIEQYHEFVHDGVTLEGLFVYPVGVSDEDKLPTVLIFHEWRGLNDYAKNRARQLAQMGYLAFAADVYGKGVYAKDHEEAGQMAGVFFGNREHMRARARANFNVVRAHKFCDYTKIVTIGYCFGGTTALELARSGAQVVGVATFHANLTTPHKDDAKNIGGRVFVFHGADDPAIPPKQVQDFEDEMRGGKVDYAIISFGNTVHSFTVPGTAVPGVALYNPDSDRRSWAIFSQVFLPEVFTFTRPLRADPKESHHHHEHHEHHHEHHHHEHEHEHEHHHHEHEHKQGDAAAPAAPAAPASDAAAPAPADAAAGAAGAPASGSSAACH